MVFSEKPAANALQGFGVASDDAFSCFNGAGYGTFFTLNIFFEFLIACGRFFCGINRAFFHDVCEDFADAFASGAVKGDIIDSKRSCC